MRFWKSSKSDIVFCYNSFHRKQNLKYVMNALPCDQSCDLTSSENELQTMSTEKVKSFSVSKIYFSNLLQRVFWHKVYYRLQHWHHSKCTLCSCMIGNLVRNKLPCRLCSQDSRQKQLINYWKINKNNLKCCKMSYNQV